MTDLMNIQDVHSKRLHDMGNAFFRLVTHTDDVSETHKAVRVTGGMKINVDFIPKR